LPALNVNDVPLGVMQSLAMNATGPVRAPSPRPMMVPPNFDGQRSDGPGISVSTPLISIGMLTAGAAIVAPEAASRRVAATARRDSLFIEHLSWVSEYPS
jgi:hypothetical protein